MPHLHALSSLWAEDRAPGGMEPHGCSAATPTGSEHVGVHLRLFLSNPKSETLSSTVGQNTSL